METLPDGTVLIRWMPGTMRVEHETRIEGNDVVVGYRIDGGDFKETSRLCFSSKSELDEVRPAFQRNLR